MNNNTRSIRGVAASVQTMARQGRRLPTPAEDTLWESLRGGRLHGLKFRRQYPLGRFILDFCCPSLRLVIEADGAIHAARTDEDEARTEHLIAFGYSVLRFQNSQILTNMPSVLTAITATAKTLSPIAPPRPELGEGAGG